MPETQVPAEQMHSTSEQKLSAPLPPGTIVADLMSRLETCDSPAAVFEVLLKYSREWLPADIVRVDFRVGAGSRRALDYAASITPEIATRISDKWLEPAAIEAQTSDDRRAQVKACIPGDQRRLVFSVPVLDELSGTPEGALTAVCIQTPLNPESVVLRIDAFAAAAAGRLRELTKSALVPTISEPVRVIPRTAVREESATSDADETNVRDAALPAAAVACDKSSHHSPSDALRLKTTACSGAVTSNEPASSTPGDCVAAAAAKPTTAASARGSQVRPGTTQSNGGNGLPAPAVFRSGSTREFAYSIVNTVANQLRAEQAAFGQNHDGRIQVLAVSGLADFKNNSPGVALMQQAMEECLDHEAPILQQPGAVDGGKIQFAIHRRWSQESGGSNVLSIPISDQAGVVAVVSIRRSAEKPFTQEEIAGLLQNLRPYGSALRMLHHITRPLRHQISAAFRSRISGLVSKDGVRAKVLLTVFSLLVLWTVFGTLTYRPLCVARVVPQHMIRMTAPVDAKLQTVHVRPGQSVTAGQPLAEFDVSELNLQLQSLERDIASSEVEVRRAIDARDTSAAALAKAHAGVLISQAASIQERIESSILVAPADGTIVRADVEQKLGQMFTTGEPVLEFAAHGGWLLEIRIPDDIRNLTTADQSGTFAAASLASHPLPFQIHSIDGMAQVIDAENIFIARATLSECPEWMKSGMEGTACVTTVPKPVWWVVSHRAIDWIRLRFWL